MGQGDSQCWPVVESHWKTAATYSRWWDNPQLNEFNGGGATKRNVSHSSHLIEIEKDISKVRVLPHISVLLVVQTSFSPHLNVFPAFQTLVAQVVCKLQTWEASLDYIMFCWLYLIVEVWCLFKAFCLFGFIYLLNWVTIFELCDLI